MKIPRYFILIGLISLIGPISPISLSAEPPAHLTLEQLRALRLPEVTLQDASQAQDGAYVDVKGTIGDAIRFELLLPDQWNERFVMGGGGGFVGSVQNGARGTVYQGYATVGTDTGHESSPGVSGAWAYTNLEAQVNFGYLGVHRTAAVSKALIRAYYGKDPAYSYFSGCSRGGGQAMMEAQRYPGDFDGIVSGAPAFNWTGIAAFSTTLAQALYPNPWQLNKTVIDKAALEKLQQSILDQCDAVDGLKDGIVQDPLSAHFDLSKVPGLTDDQRKAIAAVYAGVHDLGGNEIYPGYTPGAECDPNQWMAWIVGSIPSLVAQAQAPDLMFAFGTQIFKYLIFNNPNWDYSTYDFANFQSDTVTAASFLNATNPDLDALNARHGKLILWHGWADTALPPQATINYYRALLAHDPKAPEYCRLFMVPGCLHCGGGPGASDVDWITVIRDWVERGQAPERLIAKKSDKKKVILSRPLYSYPQSAVYKSGDPNSADSFTVKSP